MIGSQDSWVQMPVMDLYDTQMMLAAVNAARDMYNRSEERMKDFKKEYGDFITPIQADQDWYNQNVTGRVRNAINQMYAAGIDPLRSAEGRAAIASLINNIDTGSVAKLRSSAENAKEFLKARKQLEAQGLYNPLLAKYDGPDMGSYSTLDRLDADGNVIAGQGIWDKMSPTPYQDMASFSKAYFDNIQPFQRSATKNGISYTVSEINMNDLHRIADAHFNDLVQTPQGHMMYQMFLDQNGGDANAARQNFNDAVVSGNIDRLRYTDNYDQREYQMQNLAIKRQNLALRRAIAAGRQRANKSDNGGPGTELQGISLAQSWYDTAMANAYSKTSGFTKDWDQMHNMYGDFSKDAEKLFTDFGKKYSYKINPTNEELLNTETGKRNRATLEYALSVPNNKRNASQRAIYNQAMKELNADNSSLRYNNTINAYKNQFTIPMDGKSVAEIVGTPLSDNKMVAKIGEGAVDKIFGVNDIITNTAGYTKTHTASDTKAIRDAIKRWGVDNTTVTSMERGYGSLRKNTGSFEVNPEVKIVCTDDDGNVQFVGYGYYDIGLGSNSTKGGAYLGNHKTTGGAQDFGGYTFNPKMKIGNSYRGPIEIGAQRVPGLTWSPEYSTKETNMFPDYNRWTAFGVWDTDLTSKRLHAKASESLGTYGNVYSDDDLDDILFAEDEE